MFEAKSLNCPNCGSALEIRGSVNTVICKYCGSTVVVPGNLRGSGQPAEELSAEQDLYSPRHLDWLVQNGIEIMVQVDFAKEKNEQKNNNPVVVIRLVGKKANGDKFDNTATLNVPRNQVPKLGSMVRVKYSPKPNAFDIEDFVVQIGGQYIYPVSSDDDDLMKLF